MRFLITCLVLCVCALGSVSAAAVVETDVCIYGGTSGGIAAAVQSARQGKRVSLLVFSDHLGGLTTGGLGATDVGTKATIGGVSREFYKRVGAKYGLSESFNFEPKVARLVFGEMLSEAGITPRYFQRLASVQMNGVHIVSLTMEDGSMYLAKQFIDATYEGDLLAQAGVSFTVGRESTAQYGESLNGIRASTPAHQFLAAVDPYQTPGNPASGLLPLVQAEDPGVAGAGDARIQAYNYRLCFTKTAGNKLPHLVPANYDPARYELLGRYLDARISAGHTLTIGSFFNVTTMPNGKTDMNNNGAISTDYIGMNYAYPTANYIQRAASNADHLAYIQGLVYYLATSPRSPVSLQNEVLSYGPCADEWTATGGYSPQLYIREARRMVSDYVMTQGNCALTRVASDPVCQGSYNMDSHNCQRVVQGGVASNEGDVQQAPAGPYGISYRALVPKVGEADNLSVLFAISATHIAFGSTRMEPVCMMCGQAAASAAALAIDENVSMQNVPYARLALQLQADGQVLPASTGGSAGTVIVDNAAATFVGAWLSSVSVTGFYGTDYMHDQNAGQGTKSATFTPNLATAGDYDVYLRWTTNPNRATNVPVDVVHATGTATTTVNQQLNNNVWMKLGTYNFPAGTTGKLTIRTTGANGFVIADAAEWVPVAAVSGPVQVLASDAIAREFNPSGPDKARYTFVRNAADATNAVTVNFSLSGYATPSVDFVSLPTSIVIPAGQTTASLEVTALSDALAEGAETLTLQISAGSGYVVGSQASATVTLLDKPFDAWRKQYFPAFLTTSTISGAAADPDGDGLTNLQEYAMGTDPTIRGNTIQSTFANDCLTLGYTLNRAAEDLLIVVQGSRDLETWTQPVQEISRTPLTGVDQISTRLTPGIPPSSRGFIRLLISQP